MKELTFCFISCGEETSEECLKAVEPFRDSCEVIEVRNVYPQIKALQAMTEGVQTKYLVPLDADIVLNPDAYQRLREAILRFGDDPMWHTILFPLWDTLTEQQILALKLMRADILKQIPFHESATPDVEHYKRITEAGYTCIDHYLRMRPIGNHVVKGHHFCYHKYRDVYMTLRNHGWAWDEGAFKGGSSLVERSKNHFNYFMFKLASTQNEDYRSCIAGMVDGLSAPLENRSKTLASKEYSIRNDEAIHRYIWWYMEHDPWITSDVLF